MPVSGAEVCARANQALTALPRANWGDNDSGREQPHRPKCVQPQPWNHQSRAQPTGCFNWSGMRPRHQYFLKALQVILCVARNENCLTAGCREGASEELAGEDTVPAASSLSLWHRAPSPLPASSVFHFLLGSSAALGQVQFHKD